MSKLLEPDGGRPNLTIDMSGGEVIVQFDRPCQWLGFTPENAVEFAYAIYEKARQAGAKGPARSNLILPFIN
jgi:hypothetical protein